MPRCLSELPRISTLSSNGDETSTAKPTPSRMTTSRWPPPMTVSTISPRSNDRVVRPRRSTRLDVTTRCPRMPFAQRFGRPRVAGAPGSPAIVWPGRARRPPGLRRDRHQAPGRSWAAFDIARVQLRLHSRHRQTHRRRPRLRASSPMPRIHRTLTTRPAPPPCHPPRRHCSGGLPPVDIGGSTYRRTGWLLTPARSATEGDSAAAYGVRNQYHPPYATRIATTAPGHTVRDMSKSVRAGGIVPGRSVVVTAGR